MTLECFHSERWGFGYFWQFCWCQAYRCRSLLVLTDKYENWITLFTDCQLFTETCGRRFCHSYMQQITEMQDKVPKSGEESIVIWRESRPRPSFQRNLNSSDIRTKMWSKNGEHRAWEPNMPLWTSLSGSQDTSQAIHPLQTLSFSPYITFTGLLSHHSWVSMPD